MFGVQYSKKNKAPSRGETCVAVAPTRTTEASENMAARGVAKSSVLHVFVFMGE